MLRGGRPTVAGQDSAGTPRNAVPKVSGAARKRERTNAFSADARTMLFYASLP